MESNCTNTHTCGIYFTVICVEDWRADGEWWYGGHQKATGRGELPAAQPVGRRFLFQKGWKPLANHLDRDATKNGRAATFAREKEEEEAELLDINESINRARRCKSKKDESKSRALWFAYWIAIGYTRPNSRHDEEEKRGKRATTGQSAAKRKSEWRWRQPGGGTPPVQWNEWRSRFRVKVGDANPTHIYFSIWDRVSQPFTTTAPHPARDS